MPFQRNEANEEKFNAQDGFKMLWDMQTQATNSMWQRRHVQAVAVRREPTDSGWLVKVIVTNNARMTEDELKKSAWMCCIATWPSAFKARSWFEKVNGRTYVGVSWFINLRDGDALPPDSGNEIPF